MIIIIGAEGKEKKRKGTFLNEADEGAAEKELADIELEEMKERMDKILANMVG